MATNNKENTMTIEQALDMYTVPVDRDRREVYNNQGDLVGIFRGTDAIVMAMAFARELAKS
jgi:hypothetical protein